MKKKIFIIVGILAGAGLLFWIVKHYHKKVMTDPGSPAGSAAVNTPAAKSTATVPAASSAPVTGDSLEANRNGVKIYNDQGTVTHTANKGDFIGTATNISPDVNTVYFMISGSSGEIGWAYITDVQVHNL